MERNVLDCDLCYRLDNKQVSAVETYQLRRNGDKRKKRPRLDLCTYHTDIIEGRTGTKKKQNGTSYPQLDEVPDNYLTPRDAATQLGTTDSAVYLAAAKGSLTAVKVGGRTFIDGSSVEEYKKTRRPGPKSPRKVEAA